MSKPCQLWKTINEILHNKPKSKLDIKSLATSSGTVVHDKKTIANELNNYFCNIGHELFTNIPHADPSYDALIAFNSHSMALFPATNDEVTTIIHHTKNNSNLGDILPSFYIKKCHDILIDQ